MFLSRFISWYDSYIQYHPILYMFTWTVFIFRDSELYIKYYMNIFRTMVLGVLPFLALIFFNIKIYHRFMVTRGRFDRSNRGSTQVSLKHLKHFKPYIERSYTFKYLQYGNVKSSKTAVLTTFASNWTFSIQSYTRSKSNCLHYCLLKEKVSSILGKI